MSSVLVIDDNPMVRMCVARGLARAGFTVTEARDGKEALAKAPQADIVLQDMCLPDVQPRSLLKALRKATRAPIIAFSGLDRYDIGPGFDGFLQKPATIADIVDMIRGAEVAHVA